jgi:hypothetical protein
LCFHVRERDSFEESVHVCVHVYVCVCV